MIPYQTATNGVLTGFRAATAANNNLVFGDVNTTEIEILGASDTSQMTHTVFALFTPAAAAVPEPSGWAMMLLGFGAVACALRRRKSLSRPAYG